MINAAAAAASGQPDKVVLGVEPLLFGLFYLLVDLMFIEVKHFISGVIAKVKQGAQ